MSEEDQIVGEQVYEEENGEMIENQQTEEIYYEEGGEYAEETVEYTEEVAEENAEYTEEYIEEVGENEEGFVEQTEEFTEKVPEKVKDMFSDLPDPSTLEIPEDDGEAEEFPGDIYGGGESENLGEEEDLGDETVVGDETETPTTENFGEETEIPTDEIIPSSEETESTPQELSEEVKETVLKNEPVTTTSHESTFDPTIDGDTIQNMPILICEGNMTKCGSFVKNWKMRYFKLTKNGEITYYKKEGGKLLKSFNIFGMKFRHCPVKEKKKNLCLNIYAAKKKFFFHADNEADYWKWVRGLIKGHAIPLSKEASAPKQLSPEEQIKDQETEFVRIKEMLITDFEYRKIVDEKIDPSVRKSVYKCAALEEENKARMKEYTFQNWFLHFDFLKFHSDLVHYKAAKNPGLFVFEIFKSFVNLVEEIAKNHKDCIKFVIEQCTHRRVVIQFVDTHVLPGEEEKEEEVEVEEKKEEVEVEGEKENVEIKKALKKQPERFLKFRLENGQIFMNFLRNKDTFVNNVSLMELAELFHNEQMIRLDTFLNIRLVADKKMEESKLMLKGITKVDFDIQVDYPSLFPKVHPKDDNLPKLFEIISTRHIKSLVDGLRILFAHESNDFIQKRVVKYVPSKIISFDFVDDLEEGKEVELRLRDEQLVICCRSNDLKWLNSPEKYLRDEKMLGNLFTDFSTELPILLEEDIQKKEAGFQKQFGDKLESLTGAKWTFKHDWMDIVGWYDPKVKVDENTSGLTEKDVSSLCTQIYENHVKSLVDGIETMINQDEDDVCKNCILKYCSKHQISFSFVEKQETPLCELVGVELDEDGVLWITCELDGSKRKWIEKAIPMLTNTNILMEIIGNMESPPLVIQLHEKKAKGTMIELCKSFGNMLRDKGVQRAKDGPGKYDEDVKAEDWVVQVDFEGMYNQLKEHDVRIRNYGTTIKKYLALLIQRVKKYVVDDKDVRGVKKGRFKEVFHNKTVVLEFVGQKGLEDQEFRYCGIVNKEDGNLYISVKNWRVNNNEMGSRTNDLAKMLK